MVGILADDALDLPAVGVVLGVFTQVQGDAGATLCAVYGFNLEFTGAAADPAHAMLLLHAGATRFNRDLVGDDKA